MSHTAGSETDVPSPVRVRSARGRQPIGPAERGLLRQGLRYALVLRLTVVGAASTVSLFSTVAPNQSAAVVIVVVLNLWNAGYAYVRLRGTERVRRWVVPLDVAVLCGVCLTQFWTITPDPEAGAPWVLIAARFTVVTYPWLLGGTALAVATATIVTAHHLGTWLADPGGWLVSEAVTAWTLAEVALSWGLYRFVRRGARAADRVVEHGERLRRDAAVATARRGDEREYLAALHDTASATLLMVGAGVVPRRERWLADQAARDLREIDGWDATSVGEVELLGLLREVAGQSPLEIRWHTAEPVPLPAADAAVLSRGVREALTNIVRHAGTEQAEITVRREQDMVTVEVTDDGRGFDPERIPDHHYGVTRSLVERMARTGGSARIISSAGAGTTVRLTCPLSVREADGHDDTTLIATSFQRGLRRGVLVLTLAILFLLDLPRLLAHQADYRVGWPQFVTWGGLLAVTLAVAVATWRGRPLGGWRWPALAAVFALSVLATLSVRPEHLFGPAHWSEGDVGWQVVLLLMDGRVGVFATVLVAQHVMTFGLVALAGQSALNLAGAVVSTGAVLAWQLAIAMIAAVLRGLAVSTANVMRANEQVRTSEAVALQLHQDRKARYAALAGTTVPLLRGLGSGELDPAQASVRQSCAVEAARMRRLFAEDTAEPDLLLHELWTYIETAEGHGVSVSFAERGSVPELAPQVRRRLTEPAAAVLAKARGKVRITIAGAPEEVTVSVIADCQPVAPIADSDRVSISTVLSGDRLWIQATWRRHE